MDRRTAYRIGHGRRGLSKSVFADTVVPGDGVLPSDPKEMITLWPGVPPGGADPAPAADPGHQSRTALTLPSDRAIDQVGIPIMNVFRPDRPDGSAMMIAPGGGYSREMMDNEGMEAARRLNGAGVTVLCCAIACRARAGLTAPTCRCKMPSAPCGWCAPTPPTTAWTRRGSVSWVSPLAAICLAPSTRFGANVYKPVDAADKEDARPGLSRCRCIR